MKEKKMCVTVETLEYREAEFAPQKKRENAMTYHALERSSTCCLPER